MQQTKYDDVVKANIALHSKMADDYSTCEPHFRPENIDKVEKKLKTIFPFSPTISQTNSISQIR